MRNATVQVAAIASVICSAIHDRRFEDFPQSNGLPVDVWNLDADRRFSQGCARSGSIPPAAPDTSPQSAPVMRVYLIPASGLNSNVVTTGPGLICVTRP